MCGQDVRERNRSQTPSDEEARRVYPQNPNPETSVSQISVPLSQKCVFFFVRSQFHDGRGAHKVIEHRGTQAAETYIQNKLPNLQGSVKKTLRSDEVARHARDHTAAALVADRAEHADKLGVIGAEGSDVIPLVVRV